MNQEALNKFLEWIDTQIEQRGWTDYQLTKRAGISHSIMSKARSGLQPIGWEACVALASALDLPPDLVLRKAGLLPEESKYEPTLAEMNFKLSKLPEWQQRMILKGYSE